MSRYSEKDLKTFENLRMKRLSEMPQTEGRDSELNEIWRHKTV